MDKHVSSITIEQYMEFCQQQSAGCSFVSRMDNDGAVTINTKRINAAGQEITTSYLFKNLSTGGYFVQAKDQEVGTTWLGEAFEAYISKIKDNNLDNQLDDLDM